MPRSDSKIVHASAMEAKRLALQITATNDALQALLAGWDDVAWGNVTGGLSAKSPIKTTLKTDVQTVADQHNAMVTAITGELDTLKVVE